MTDYTLFIYFIILTDVNPSERYTKFMLDVIFVLMMG